MHLERHTPSPARRRGLRLASVLAVGGGLALSACGSATKQSPASAVDSSVSGLGSSSSMSMRISLGVTAAQAQQLGRQGGGSAMTPAEAQALSTGSVFLVAQTGHGEALDSNQALTDTGNAYDLGLQIGSSVPVEIRYVSQALYVRAQATQLLGDLGQDPAKAAAFENQLNQFNKYVPGISALGQGSWVEVSPSSLAALGSLLQQATGSNTSAAAQIQTELAQLRTSAFNAFKANSTSRSLGTQSGRPGYAVTLDVHGFLGAFGPTLQKDLQSLPLIGPKLSSDFARLQKSVPAGRTVTGDVYTSGGKLSEVDVDLRQFAGSHKVDFAVPLKVAFTSASAVAVPQGAKVLDLSQLPKLLQGLLSGGLGSNHPGGTTFAS